MRLINCKLCHQPFHAEQDLAQDETPMCDECCENYQAACVKIHQYILENERPQGYQLKDIGHLMSALQLPRTFVQMFFQESELKKSIISKDHSVCSRCNITLSPNEKKYCRSCVHVLAEVAESIQISTGTFGRSAQRHRGRRGRKENNRYGFGKD